MSKCVINVTQDVSCLHWRIWLIRLWIHTTATLLRAHEGLCLYTGWSCVYTTGISCAHSCIIKLQVGLDLGSLNTLSNGLRRMLFIPLASELFQHTHAWRQLAGKWLGVYSLQHGGALNTLLQCNKVKLTCIYSPYWLRSKQDYKLVNYLVFSFGLPAFARCWTT